MHKMNLPFVLFTALYASSALAAALPTDHVDTDKAILLLADGTTKTIEKTDLASHLNGTLLETPTDKLPRSLKSANFNGLQKRGDPQIIIPLPDQEFLGWDIPMSTIVHANQADATVAMASGQSIANSISVGYSFTATVEKFLQVGVTTNYQYTKTSTLTGTVTMTIPKNKWGAIVSNPLTHRKRGYVFTGSPGSGQFEYYQADSFTDETYTYNDATLNWVKGVVTTCLSDTYPVKRCVGEGELK
ncbi:hypothetical protein CNMCM5623_004831 [Aspergillus felis]|uniref:Uncharacterized protein n=1 Tax=Aspergillus felis TaxID=1287682 RepID=A0A8H6ULP5_9EURO|nr:hypothetical protein CNMCM5623_004831 [Aspergillus felis]KAF7181109.1 hypothetical protein CNMCM7691_000238 [Aspergillus felis]